MERQEADIGSKEVLEKAETGVSVDKTLFRIAQELRPTVTDQKVLDGVVEDAKEYTIVGEGVEKRLFDFVEDYKLSVKQPFAVEYFDAKEVYNDNTSEFFEKIDEFILEKLEDARQNKTLDAYIRLLAQIEEALGLTNDSELFHRITELNKFIDNGTKRTT